LKYLLDTNIISELYKINCNPNVKSFIDIIDIENIYITAITIGEITYGIEKLPVSKKKHELSIWLYTKIPQWFNNRIINLDTDLLAQWGIIRAKSKKTLPVIDSLIAAAAIAHNMYLVTRNTDDFQDIEGINLINPFD